MTTFIKHYFVDPTTGEAFYDNRQAPNGKTHPAIEGLDVQYWLKDANDVDYCLSITDSAFDQSAIEGVTVIDEAEWFALVEAEFNKVKANKVKEVFDHVKTIKAKITDDWWHSSEISAGVGVKVTEATFVLSQTDEAAAIAGAPVLAAEAGARQISIFDLANRISTHNTVLINAEAVISGHRGFITDKIDAITFTATLDGSKASFAAVSAFTNNSDRMIEGGFNYVESFNTVLTELGL